MKVLVTGGTGFVGRHVVRALLVNGHTVRLLARRPGRLPNEPGALQVTAGDILQPDSLPGAVAGVDGVVHLVGIISEFGRSTFERVHLEGTRNLVGATVRAGVRRLVHMSALGTRADAVSRYHQTKWAAEECVRASGLDFTIFRPSLIYGPGDQFVNLFDQIGAVSPVVPLLGRPDAKYQPIAVDLVAAAFARSLTEPKAIGATFELCGLERFTLRELVGLILLVRGRRRLLWHIPANLAWAQARLLEAVYPWLLRRAPPLNRDQLQMLNEDNVGNPGPADILFGLHHQSFREGIAGYLRRSPIRD